MKAPKFVFTEEFLIRHYVQQNKSAIEIAHEVGLKSKTSVLNALRKYKIPRRPSNTRGGLPSNARRCVGNITKSCWFRIKQCASRRNIRFNITPEYAWKLFQQQNGKCSLSGIDLQFATLETNEHKGTQTASLDRIDSSLGYEPGNVQWVHKKVQSMKMDMTQQEFLQWCKRISANDNNILS